MTDEKPELKGPDLTQGVALDTLADGAMLLGHAQGEPVLLARRGAEVFAIGAVCTHYSGPLDQGLMVGDTVRCPWHHACFSLRTGEMLRAPALNNVDCWHVEQRDGKAFVREKVLLPARPTPASAPRAVVIVGGGAAGNAAAEMLRRQGFDGSLTMLSADADVPCDRPNLSKDYLAGTAPEEYVPLRSLDFYREHRIDLRLNMRVSQIDTAAKQVHLAGGGSCAYDALLLATGAEPVRLDIPGADLPLVHYLRTVADCRALIAKVESSKRAVVLGASFIGMEVAASLRTRKLDVTIVAPEACPFERVLGPEVGQHFKRLHEQHGVVFRLGMTATSIAADGVTLKDGTKLPADLVVIGVGVRPALSLAEQAGIATDRGVKVNEYLETSVPGIYAAGDIARWPDRLTGQPIRVEHWVVAERQGQVAALNMLGRREPFDQVAFFWTVQYDFGLAYVGHAEKWDSIAIDGSLEAQDCAVSYKLGGRTIAQAIVGRDLEGLRTERALEVAMSK